MSSHYMPTTEQVRSAYAIDIEAEYRDPVNAPMWQRENERNFDRWLAAHDEQVRAAALRESREQAWREGYYTGKRDYAGSLMGGMPMSTPNPYRTPAEQKESKTND